MEAEQIRFLRIRAIEPRTNHEQRTNKEKRTWSGIHAQSIIIFASLPLLGGDLTPTCKPAP